MSTRERDQHSLDTTLRPRSTALDPPAPASADASELSRRKFIGGIGGAAAIVAGAGALPLLGQDRAVAAVAGAPADDAEAVDAAAEAADGNPGPPTRRMRAYRMRGAAALQQYRRRPPAQTTNGDEQRYPSRIGNFSKGLPHDGHGEVDAAAWASLVRAVASGDPRDFEAVRLGGGRPLTNPQAGLAFDLEGADAFALTAPAAPALASAEAAGEMVELYWMALLRDVDFADYAADPLAAAAAADLNALSRFNGPRENGQVTPQTLFRDTVAGAEVGPYISQFMWLPTPFGVELVDRHMRTLLPGDDHLTDFGEWLNVQNGGLPSGKAQFDPQRRHVRNGRDLAQWVHVDVLFQAYFNAYLILQTPPSAADAESGGIGCPLNPTNPYLGSKTQAGFCTFGPPGIACLLTEVGVRGLKATWHQKWFAHRRLRPEEFGGRVQVQKTTNRYAGVLHGDVLGAPVLERVHAKFGSFLHPVAFPEGCPTHPSYTAGHATVAGACVTVLKAMFDETFVIPQPVVPSPDGLVLLPYSGAPLTVGGELNKLASNVATGRNIAGVHWRSDAIESLRLGEAMAISILRDHKLTYNETRGGFFSGFSFTAFDGSKVTI